MNKTKIFAAFLLITLLSSTSALAARTQFFGGYWTLGSDSTSISYSGGKVGVGTTTAVATFSIQGIASSTMGSFLIASSSGATQLSTDSAGNVSIPTVAATTTIAGGLVVHTNSLVVQQNGGGVLIGTAVPQTQQYALLVSGNIVTTGNNSGVIIQERATNASTMQIYATSLVQGPCFFDHQTASDYLCMKTGVGLAVGSSTPAASFQASNRIDAATTSLIFGKNNDATGAKTTKGTCMTFFDTAGSPVYMFIATGATTFTAQNGGTAPSGCVK